METIVDYFVEIFHQDNHYELPLNVVVRLNELDRATRGDLKSRLFNEAKRLGQNGDGLRAIRWLENAFLLIEKNSFRYHQVLFSPGKDIPENIAFLLDRATTTIDLCVFTISDSRLADKLVEAHQRGVKVRIITDDQKCFDDGSQVFALQHAGIPVKTDDSRYHMHHKFAVVDGRLAFSGSYNWTYTAQNHNQENLVITTNYTIVHQFIEEYESLWHQMVWLKPQRA
ncbi:MAG: DUF1669 domain-containing protein [Breznakibacter sp.]|nr:DUF1669 domain-containing protein [Breznakibacter sp.]